MNYEFGRCTGKILLDFFKALTLSTTPEVELYNFDGRVNNESKRKAAFLREEEKTLNCLNCYSNRYRYCIEIVPIDEKTNEIPTIEKLIKGMNLKGVIATWDALNSQVADVKALKQFKVENKIRREAKLLFDANEIKIA